MTERDFEEEFHSLICDILRVHRSREPETQGEVASAAQKVEDIAAALMPQIQGLVAIGVTAMNAGYEQQTLGFALTVEHAVFSDSETLAEALMAQARAVVGRACEGRSYHIERVSLVDSDSNPSWTRNLFDLQAEVTFTLTE